MGFTDSPTLGLWGTQHSGLCYMGPSPTHEGSTLMTQPQEGPHFPAPSHGLRPQWMKLGETESCSVVSDSHDPVDCTAHGFSRPEYWSGEPFPSSGDLPSPGIEPRSPALQKDSLPAEPPGKPKNTGVGSCPLLQRIFLTQESNRVLLHCRWILYRLSHQVASLIAQFVKNPLAMWETWVRKIPWRREQLPTPVFWPGEFHFTQQKLHHETGRGNPNFQPPTFHPCISVNLPGVAKVQRSYLSSCC